MVNNFDRFTSGALGALILAQERAIEFNHCHIATEHLLLGLVGRDCDEEDPTDIATIVLNNFGIEPVRVRRALEFIVGRGSRELTCDPIPTDRAELAIGLAIEEVRLAGDCQIGTEHILLGLIREGDGVANSVLADLGINLERARFEVARVKWEVEEELEDETCEFCVEDNYDLFAVVEELLGLTPHTIVLVEG